MRLSQGPRVVGSAVNRFRFPVRRKGRCSGHPFPLAPRLAPDRVFQDRNMALTWSNGAPGGTRTPGPLLRRQLLYPAELQALTDDCAGSRSRRGHVPDTTVIKARGRRGPPGTAAGRHDGRHAETGDRSWLTAILWILSVAAHLGFDYVVAGHNHNGFGNATILLYLAVTFSVQRLLVQARAQRAAIPAQAGPASFA